MAKLLTSLSLFFSCVLVFFISGCLTPQELYIGNKVTAEQVPLASNVTRAGTWETFDLKIAYNVVTKGEALEISGKLALGDSYQTVYDHVRSLDVYLFLLDSDSRVLLTEPLDRTFWGTTRETVSFNRTYVLPAGTTAFSFGYSGVVAEQTDQTSFYLLPLKE